MEFLWLALAVVAGVMLSKWLGKNGWGKFARISTGVLAGVLVFAFAMASLHPAPARDDATAVVAPAPKAAQDAPVADKPSDTDAAIRKLDKRIVAVDHQPYATPPKLVLTLAGDGWDEAGMFYGFAISSGAVLDDLAKAKLLPDGQDVVFILRAPMTGGDPINVLHLTLPAADAAALAGTRPTVPAVLERASVEFNGRHGREIVTAFCADAKFQGGAGLARTPKFCDLALR